jgi:hypothetical protein
MKLPSVRGCDNAKVFYSTWPGYCTVGIGGIAHIITPRWAFFRLVYGILPWQGGVLRDLAMDINIGRVGIVE